MLPWIEKYRPNSIQDVILEDDTKQMLYSMIETKQFPQLLFYGPPGTGKTTTIICLLKMYQEKYKCSNNIMHLNASNDRGIDVIRNQIYTFISLDDKKNQVDELTETFAILYKKEIYCDDDGEDYDEIGDGFTITEVVDRIAKSKVKDYKSLTNKSLFKFMDLVDM